MFQVFVSDNFSYMESDATDRHGEFETWEEARTAAQAIVDRSLQKLYRPGASAAELFQEYRSFGEDPFISPVPTGERFSAWEYAEERCASLCSEGKLKAGGASQPAAYK